MSLAQHAPPPSHLGVTTFPFLPDYPSSTVTHKMQTFRPMLLIELGFFFFFTCITVKSLRAVPLAISPYALWVWGHFAHFKVIFRKAHITLKQS